MRAANHLLTVLILSGFTFTSCGKKENKDNELAALTTVVATPSELPACSFESMSKVYWVQEQSKLYVCNGSEFVEITGSKGEQGEKGEKGDSGEKGSEGSPANSGVWVFDKDGQTIGVLMDAKLGLILFTDGSSARINLQTGEYAMPVKYINGVMDVAPVYVCTYTDTACASTCYVEAAPPRGTILRAAASSYVVVTGTESLENGLTGKRYNIADASCLSPGGDVPMNAFPITTTYSFPEGISLPLQVPLSFGFKTED